MILHETIIFLVKEKILMTTQETLHLRLFDLCGGSTNRSDLLPLVPKMTPDTQTAFNDE